ncbi:response regulator [Paraburkholderia sp. Ac-20340]|uniref:ATP-binding protein n=1 Tax=Paraburkholderia sp. Ac-20340 TaxID=2703888 RepID=UPI001982150D|nr:ATP-binding protein [Paraburkholderia sp. Ac-20340]MBN3855020.1 response regulator [Paraburkholderia sp. Ac-20340]
MKPTEFSKIKIGSTYRRPLVMVGACVIVICVCVSAAWDSWRARNLALQGNNRELSSISSALAEQAARSLQEIQLILRRTSVTANVPQQIQIPDKAIEDFLKREVADVPQIRELSIFDAAGNRIASSEPPGQPDIDIAPREYFRQIQHSAPGATVISQPLKSLADSKPTFAVAIGMWDSAGHFQGAVRALVEDDYFERFYREVDLGRGTQIQLSLDDGVPVVAFSRELDPGDTADLQSAQRIVTGFPLRVTVSRDRRVVLADWHDSFITALVRTSSISLLVAVLALALARQMRRQQTLAERLHSSEQRWRAVFENAPIGVVVLRTAGQFIASNPAFQHMVGYSGIELAKLNAIEISHEEDARGIQGQIARLIGGDIVTARFEQRFVHRDGTMIWTDISIARVSSSEYRLEQSSGHEDVLVATLEDVTQRRLSEIERSRLEAQLMQAQKLEALGTFAGGIAHDFNNILGAILGYGERALHALDARTPAHRYIEQVMNAGNRARSLVERILTFSRSGMVARLPVRLSPVVAETIDLLEARVPAGIGIVLRMKAGDIVVMGDPTHIHQVVMNLCSNALHAMPHGGTLTVALERVHLAETASLTSGLIGPGDFARLCVADTGVGMDAALIERIFNPFFTTRGAGEGTGLGLSLVDSIAREYGGAVSVISAPGNGSRFEVFLPVSSEVAPDVVHEPAALPQGDGQVVLVVDDERALVSLAEELLAELGYEPVGFQSSSAAWEAFASDPERFDAVISDQTMPELSGLELAARVRQIRPTIPVILCSGYGTPELEKKAIEAGVRMLLRKPLQQIDIARALHQIFAG